MNYGSTPGASYALQVKTSRFLLKKFTNSLFTSNGILVPIWKYLSSSFPMTILSNPSHDTEESEEANRMGIDSYKVGVDSYKVGVDFRSQFFMLGA